MSKKILMIGNKANDMFKNIANELHVMNNRVWILTEKDEPNNLITDKKLIKSFFDLTKEDLSFFDLIIKINEFKTEEIKEHDFLITLSNEISSTIKIVFNTHVGSLLLNDSMPVLLEDLDCEKGLSLEEKRKSKISTHILNLYRKTQNHKLHWLALAIPLNLINASERKTNIHYHEEIFTSDENNHSEMSLSTFCYGFSKLALSSFDNELLFNKQLLIIEKNNLNKESQQNKIQKILNDFEFLKEEVKDKLEDVGENLKEKFKETKEKVGEFKNQAHKKFNQIKDLKDLKNSKDFKDFKDFKIIKIIKEKQNNNENNN